MKRKISFAILTMITFLFMFNGCSSNAYSVKICGYSDSVPEIKTDLEYSKWTQGSYEDKNQPVSVELKIRNENILGQYTDSRILTYNYYPTHTYKINYNNYFSIDPDKKLTSYFWGQSETSVPSDDLSENDYIKIAQDFLSQIIDLQDYRISIKYIENYELYRIYFTKYIGELKTADEATVEVDRAGNLYSYSSFMLGRIPADSKINFDIDKVNEIVYSRLDRLTADARESYDSVEYDIIARTLTMTDESSFALVYTVNVNCINRLDGSDLHMSERIQFIIQ